MPSPACPYGRNHSITWSFVMHSAILAIQPPSVIRSQVPDGTPQAKPGPRCSLERGKKSYRRASPGPAPPTAQAGCGACPHGSGTLLRCQTTPGTQGTGTVLQRAPLPRPLSGFCGMPTDHFLLSTSADCASVSIAIARHRISAGTSVHRMPSYGAMSSS